MRITNMNFIRFDKISVNRIMNYNTFKESLGILGVSHAQFLSERIFRIIDRNNT